MKKLSLYIFLVLMWCNVGFAEIKYKKVECEDEIFIDFIDNDISNAIDSYLEFLELYPKSIYYDDVRLRLRELAS